METEERITPGHTKGGDPPYIFAKLPLAPRQAAITAPQTWKKANLQGLSTMAMKMDDRLKSFLSLKLKAGFLEEEGVWNEHN